MPFETLQLPIDGLVPRIVAIDLHSPHLYRLASIQQRERLDPAKIAEYTSLYQEGRDLGEVTIFQDGEELYVADGFHRITAALDAGRVTLPALLRRGTLRDATLHACSCNLHGVPLTNADKRRRVLTMLHDAAWVTWSDGTIARHCGVTQPFVSKVRTSLKTVMSDPPPQPTTRVFRNRHGQTATMETAAIGQKGAPAPSPLFAAKGQVSADATEDLARGAPEEFPVPDLAPSPLGSDVLQAPEPAPEAVEVPENHGRRLVLGDIGDPSAPPGSAPWARAVQVELWSLLDEATSDLRAIRLYLKGLVEHKGYQHLNDTLGHPFPSLRAFAEAKRPWGLGYDGTVLDVLIHEQRMAVGDESANLEAQWSTGVVAALEPLTMFLGLKFPVLPHDTDACRLFLEDHVQRAVGLLTVQMATLAAMNAAEHSRQASRPAPRPTPASSRKGRTKATKRRAYGTKTHAILKSARTLARFKPADVTAMTKTESGETSNVLRLTVKRETVIDGQQLKVDPVTDEYVWVAAEAEAGDE